ncbi:hypothetical protein NW733_00015 [Mycoplasmopsis felis]|uniref:hypothetical protein n=1 Tax=Mycoplasmopsis felis TaxID=33923 RepID=UPI0021E06FC9|nr:hypothetical protein [Mycoplasmopsis felis]MCU9931178.1 hypothetical protein [Mycoplasmopsis felis]
MYADINWDILESLLKEFYRSIGIYELNSIKEIKNKEWKKFLILLNLWKIISMKTYLILKKEKIC